MNWGALVLAHFLSFHAHVPEPMTFEFKDISRREVCAQVFPWTPVHDTSLILKWSLQYDQDCWKRYPQQRALVIAHEVCHAIHDHEVAFKWEDLGEVEQYRRHLKVRECAEDVVRRCREEHGGGWVK